MTAAFLSESSPRSSEVRNTLPSYPSSFDIDWVRADSLPMVREYFWSNFEKLLRFFIWWTEVAPLDSTLEFWTLKWN